MKIAIYNMHFATLGGGERRTSALAAHLAKEHDVTLFVLSPVSPATIKTVFGIDISKAEIVPLAGQEDHFSEIARYQPDLFINNSFASQLANPAPLGIYMCMFPEPESVDLGTYQVITANSAFTAEWIKTRWRRPSEIVYSACQNMGPPPAKKEKIILNVARFFADREAAHHKRQDILLHAFKQAVDRGLSGWELHFIGMIGAADGDRAFVEHLRSTAAGYPVQVRPAVDFGALQDAFRKSSIYWHATGFGSCAARQPMRQEHLGMSIIEAMSAGAVPIAFNSGGPREIIDPGVNGYLWNDLPELTARSLHLIQQPLLLQRMSAAAALSSRSFDVSGFLARMDRIIADLNQH
jgi:glycosyltransferase involved in cell wall biosynthesis